MEARKERMVHHDQSFDHLAHGGARCNHLGHCPTSKQQNTTHFLVHILMQCLANRTLTGRDFYRRLLGRHIVPSLQRCLPTGHCLCFRILRSSTTPHILTHFLHYRHCSVRGRQQLHCYVGWAEHPRCWRWRHHHSKPGHILRYCAPEIPP